CRRTDGGGTAARSGFRGRQLHADAEELLCRQQARLQCRDQRGAGDRTALSRLPQEPECHLGDDEVSVSPAKSAPQPIVLEGHYVRLEPIAQRHAADIFAVSTMAGGPERYRWLFSTPPATLAEVEERIAQSQTHPDRYVAVV